MLNNNLSPVNNCLLYCQFLSISLPLYMLQLKSLHVMIEFFLEYLGTWALHDRYTITVMVQDILRFYVNSRNFSSQCPLITTRSRNRIFSHYVLVNMLCAYVYIYNDTAWVFRLRNQSTCSYVQTCGSSGSRRFLFVEMNFANSDTSLQIPWHLKETSLDHKWHNSRSVCH